MRRRIAKFYFNQIKLNSQKYIEVNIEEKERIDCEGFNSDDIYLLQTYHKIKAPIITTDTRLKEILKSKGIPCELRDTFLKNYLQKET